MADEDRNKLGDLADIVDTLRREASRWGVDETAKRVQMILDHIGATTPPRSQSRSMTFTAGSDLYKLNEDATALDIQDHLSARLGQLVAMLGQVTGEGFEYFSRRNHTLQEEYLWGCEMLADECEDLVKSLTEASFTEITAEASPELTEA